MSHPFYTQSLLSRPVLRFQCLRPILACLAGEIADFTMLSNKNLFFYFYYPAPLSQRCLYTFPFKWKHKSAI